MPPGSEVHEREADIWHFVASRRDRVVGCVLLLPDSTTQTGRLLQMAVHGFTGTRVWPTTGIGSRGFCSGERHQKGRNAC